MYALVVEYMNFKAAVFNISRLPLAPDPSSSVSDVERAPPLCESEWKTFFNKDGRILNESALRKAIFKGGISDDIRSDVWMFLFGFYSFSSTSREREAINVECMVQYDVLKERWKTELEKALSKDDNSCEELQRFLCPWYASNTNNDNADSPLEETNMIEKQQMMFLKIVAQINVNKKKINIENLRHFLKIIDKDVPRTDRNFQFYQDPKNLLALRNILITYVSFCPEIGYTQGMNDLVSRFHVVLKSEYKTYYCFLNFMERVESEFLENGMIAKLELIQTLLRKMDEELSDFFKSLDIKELLFCHRWLLLNFKREFDYEDSLKIFEIISSHHLEIWSTEAEKERRRKRAEELQNQDGQLYAGIAEINADFTFDLFVCVAILVSYREELSKCEDLSSIYNTLNGLAMHMDLNRMLVKAESLFLSYCRNSVTDCFQVVEFEK